MTGLERIQKTFHNGKAYVGYLTAGDGGHQRSVNAALALIKGGINILEIGVPFSDPIADGLVIQRASARALQSKTTLHSVLAISKAIRAQTEIPLILFSYYNPILAAMKPSLFQEIKEAGISGLLIVDCPMEESQELYQQCRAHGLPLIYVVTPSTPAERLKLIATQAAGFIYYACREGTTGIKSGLPENFSEKIELIKKTIPLPVVAGFGISERSVVEKILQHADGVVIGSLFVKALESNLSFEDLAFLASTTYPKTN